MNTKEPAGMPGSKNGFLLLHRYRSAVMGFAALWILVFLYLRGFGIVADLDPICQDGSEGRYVRLHEPHSGIPDLPDGYLRTERWYLTGWYGLF